MNPCFRRCLWLVVLPALLAGCVGTLEVELPPPPQRPAGPPLAIGPLAVGYRPSDPGAESVLPPYRPGPPGPPAWRQLASWLGERGTVSRSILLDMPDPILAKAANPGLADLLPTDPERRRVPLRQAALEAGAAWLLDLELLESRILHDTNGVHPFKWVTLVVSSLLVFPAIDPLNWFLPGEVYTSELDVAWRLEDLSTGAVLGQGKFTAQARDDFAAFNLGGPSRAWGLLGFVRVPGMLDPEDWAEIEAELRPQLEEQLAARLVQVLEAPDVVGD